MRTRRARRGAAPGAGARTEPLGLGRIPGERRIIAPMARQNAVPRQVRAIQALLAAQGALSLLSVAVILAPGSPWRQMAGWAAASHSGGVASPEAGGTRFSMLGSYSVGPDPRLALAIAVILPTLICALFLLLAVLAGRPSHRIYIGLGFVLTLVLILESGILFLAVLPLVTLLLVIGRPARRYYNPLSSPPPASR